MPTNPHTKDAQQEKRERFMALLTPVQKRLEGFAFAMAHNREDALDLVGETVLRAYEHFEGIKDERAFLGYLFRIASRVHQRKRWRGRLFGSFDEDGADHVAHGGTPPDVSADVAMLYEALGQLPERQREAIVLFEISGLLIREIQEIQGGSISNVKMRLNRARKRLAVLLGANEPQPSEAEIISVRSSERESYRISFDPVPNE